MNKLRILRILPVFPMIFCAGCDTHTKSNVEDYFEILGEARKNSDFHTQLYLFPETIEGAEIVKFLYQETSDLFTGSYFFYLALTYNEADFNAEVQRMSQVKATFKNGVVKNVIAYPEQSAFLTIDKNGRYEYSLYNKETLEIAYLSNQLYDWKQLTVLEERHKMPDFAIPEAVDDGEHTYNMYYCYQGGIGYEITDDFPA